MNRRLTLVLGAALAVALAGPALAGPKATTKEGVRRVLEEAGLMGYFAQDCSRPAASDNAWEAFTVGEDGWVMNADYEGTDGSSMYVTQARRLNSHEVWFQVSMDIGDPQLDLVYRIEGDRHRTWHSQEPDEHTYLIRKGKWVGPEPGESQWYTRCPREMLPADFARPSEE